MASLSTSHVPPLIFSVVFESSNLNVHELLTKKPKRSYDKSRIFQDSWAAMFLWEKLVLGEDSQISLVKCMICSVVEGKNKFLSLKLGILQKHVGKKKQLLFVLELMLGIGTTIRILHMQKMRGYMVVHVLKQFYINCNLVFIFHPKKKLCSLQQFSTF
jgi:hypothetical protein